MSQISQGTPSRFRAGAMHVDHRFGSQVADARLKLHAALRRDHQQAVESDGAANIATERYANAARLGSHALRVARCAFLPPELLGTAVESFFQEATGGIAALAANLRRQIRLCLQDN